MKYACVCVTQVEGEFEREGEELRDDRVVRERESRSPGEGEVAFYASKTDINHVSI